VSRQDQRHARRHCVKWPARVRAIGELAWQAGQVVDLSVTGVLLRVDYRYAVGAQVEVEIDFLTQPKPATVVSGVGLIVRDHPARGEAAISFQVECGIAERSIDAQPADELAHPSARQARAAGLFE